jgi:hypothetical protein
MVGVRPHFEAVLEWLKRDFVGVVVQPSPAHPVNDFVDQRVGQGAQFAPRFNLKACLDHLRLRHG